MRGIVRITMPVQYAGCKKQKEENDRCSIW